MIRKLLFLSFIEGAAVMAAELCGAKLLAPIFGSSLYVWAAVMGITLAALAAGYFFGGWSCARVKDQQKTLFNILCAASIFILLMPVFSYYLVPRMSYLPFLAGMVLSTLCILFFPVFFLGAASPLFVVLQTNEQNNAGRVSGTVYAVSTAGGISATFLCGFYLIPSLGLSFCLFLFGALLLVFNFLVFKRLGKGNLILMAVVVYLNLQIAAQPKNTLLSSDSVLGRLDILDIQTARGSVRLLKINDIIQSEMDLKTGLSVSPYVHLLDTLIAPAKDKGQALVLGLGAGLTANILNTKHYRTQGVEFDPRITEAAGHFFFLAAGISTVNSDARAFLNSCQQQYKLILFDLFKAEEQPSHVLTLESLVALKKNLSDSSRVLVCWHGYTEGSKGRGTAVLKNTFLKAGYRVKICAMSQDETTRNLIFVASLAELPSLPFELPELALNSAPINTDDLPCLERFNAEANKAWRLQYLRYYQGKPGN